MIEKKLKKSAEKIVMPDELKSRILEKCGDSVQSETSAEEIRFTVEPYRRCRVSHIVSWAAALAIVIGGLGYSTHLITKEGFSPDSINDILSNAPFGSIADANIDIYTCRFWTTFHNYEISDEVKAQINEFFSNMEYIEKEGYYYPPENINPDRPYMAYTIALLDTTNDINNSQDCLSVLEDDTLSYNHSGIYTYYQIDSKAFDELIRSILPVCAPFGNLAERDNYTVEIDTETSVRIVRIPDESQKNLLAGLFNGIKTWELIEDYDTSSLNARHVITFNDDESVFICEDDVLVYNRPDGTKEFYRIDFNETDKNMRYYMRKPAPFGSIYDYGNEYDAYINISGEDYPVDHGGELSDILYKFFDAIDWIPIENYDNSAMDIRHEFVFNDDMGSIYISADDKIIYNNPDGVAEVYNINFAEFDELIKSLYPYKYDKEIKCGFFSELDGCKLSASLFRSVSIDGGAGSLDEKDSAKILEVLNSICIEEIPEPENAVFKNIGLDSISFDTFKETDGIETSYSIHVNLIKKYVMFSKKDKYGAETHFFRTDEANIMILLRNLRSDSAVYPPLASLWKTDDCTCTSELFNGILSYEQAIMVTTAFYGWDWSDACDLDSIRVDLSGELRYKFSTGNQNDICVYDDGIVIVGKRLYQNIDHNGNNSLLYILDSTFSDDINPDNYNTQHEYPDGISQDDKDMLDDYNNIS